MAKTTFKKVKLGDVAEIIDCPHSTPNWADKGIFAVRNYNLSNGRIVKEKCSYVDKETFELRTRRAMPKKGDCILSREAPIGSVGYVNSNEHICLGQRVVLIRPNDAIDSRFLLYQLLSSDIQNQFRQSDSSGSTVSNLRIPSIKKTDISITDINAQKIISSTIGAYDDLIENNERRIKILEEMAQRLYTEWFVKFKYPGHEKVRILDSGIQYGMIPEGWEVKKLREVSNLVRGCSYSSDQIMMVRSIIQEQLTITKSLKQEILWWL
jgi:type I restriction enzyme S subunit